MKRVVVVGCPGVGKTTFVRKLAAKTKLPVIHLDYYYHQKKYDYYNDKQAWIEKVKELIKQDEWIMDGNYGSSIEPRFKRADTIIFLDYPRRVAMFGMFRRRLKYHRKLREEMPSDWKERADLEFIKYTWRFGRRNRPKILGAIADNPRKRIVIFKNRKRADAYLASL